MVIPVEAKRRAGIAINLCNSLAIPDKRCALSGMTFI